MINEEEQEINNLSYSKNQSSNYGARKMIDESGC